MFYSRIRYNFVKKWDFEDWCKFEYKRCTHNSLNLGSQDYQDFLSYNNIILFLFKLVNSIIDKAGNDWHIYIYLLTVGRSLLWVTYPVMLLMRNRSSMCCSLFSWDSLLTIGVELSNWVVPSLITGRQEFSRESEVNGIAKQ